MYVYVSLSICVRVCCLTASRRFDCELKTPERRAKTLRFCVKWCASYPSLYFVTLCVIQYDQERQIVLHPCAVAYLKNMV